MTNGSRAATPGAQIDFNLPIPFVVARALAGYMFALTSLIYTSLGKPQERDRLKAKDKTIADLKHNHEVTLENERRDHEETIDQLQRDYDAIITNERQQKDGMLSQTSHHYETELETLKREKFSIQTQLNAETNRLNGELAQQKAENEKYKTLLAESQNKESELLKAMSKSDEAGLEGYSQECINWLKSGAKTVIVADITRYTGHSKRKIDGLITRGILQTSTRNKELITVSSLLEWLKITPPNSSKEEHDSGPLLHIVNE